MSIQLRNTIKFNASHTHTHTRTHTHTKRSGMLGYFFQEIICSRKSLMTINNMKEIMLTHYTFRYQVFLSYTFVMHN